MAKPFLTSNNEGAKRFFEKRTKYNLTLSYISPQGNTYKNLVDFNFAEKFLYGRVDRSFVPMVVNEGNSYIEQRSGATSRNAQHTHKYQIDSKGNGWALEVAHPKQPKIRHRHKITNYVVDPARSNCYPKCREKYDVRGAPLHTHTLLDKDSTTKEIAQIKKFGSEVTGVKTASALNFVVDAFNDLSLQFRKCVLANKIDDKDPFLSNLVVYKAYQSPKSLYGSNKNIYLNTIAAIFRKKKIKVKNFDEFMDHFLRMSKTSLHRNPITKPGFIKSKRCPIMASGLAIEIADLDPANDQEKINQFVNSNNWDFYLNACAAYGFMVDQFVPWRLVADIGSAPTLSPMFDYAKKYDLNTTNDIVNNVYEPAYSDYYETFKLDFLRLYNTVKPKHFTEVKECDEGTIRYTVVPQKYTIESFYAAYSDEYFLEVYFNMRFSEEESQFKDSEKGLLINQCIQLYLINRNVDDALSVFEKIINKTLDYRGSLSYIKKHLDAFTEEHFSKGY